MGDCGFVCNGGYADCDELDDTGCESNLQFDPATCGGCDTECNSNNGTPVCQNRVCSVQCFEGYGDCDDDPPKRLRMRPSPTIVRPGDFVDQTMTSELTIQFGGPLGNAYSPRCIKVLAGTTVTFVGNFSPHPLVGGAVTDGVQMPDPSSPISFTSAGTSASFTLTAPGQYPYYCDNHTDLGMYGAILVP